MEQLNIIVGEDGDFKCTTVDNFFDANTIDVVDTEVEIKDQETILREDNGQVEEQEVVPQEHEQTEEVVSIIEFQDRCIICGIIVDKLKGAWVNLNEECSSTSQKTLLDLVHTLVINNPTVEYKFMTDTMCRRCFNLLDRADEIEEKTKSMMEELKTIKFQLRSTFSVTCLNSKDIIMTRKKTEDKPEENPVDQNENTNHKKKKKSSLKNPINNLYTCPCCTDTFEDKESLASHFDDNHSMDSWVECHLCNQEFIGGIRQYLLHLASKHPNCLPREGIGMVKVKRKQRDCYESVPNRKININKRKRLNGSEPDIVIKNVRGGVRMESDDSDLDNFDISFEKVSCTKCSSKFDSNDKLLQHMKYAHGKKQNYKCNDCQMMFQNAMEKVNHISKCTRTPPLSNKKKSEEESTANTNLESCSLCSKEFNSLSDLKTHMKRNHPKSVIHSCPICDQMFRSKKGLKNHISLVHPDDTEALVEYGIIENNQKQKPCPYCSQSYRLTALLKTHVLQKHSWASLFRCPECQSTFVTAAERAEHMIKKHSNNIKTTDVEFHISDDDLLVESEKRDEEGELNISDNSFQNISFPEIKEDPDAIRDQIPDCYECNETFLTAKSYNIHLRQVHSVTKIYYDNVPPVAPDKLVSCPVCNSKVKYIRLFSHISSLHTHELLYPCTQCDLLFIKESLRKKHTKEYHCFADVDGKFMCTECNEEFDSAPSLKIHLATFHDS